MQMKKQEEIKIKFLGMVLEFTNPGKMTIFILLIVMAFFITMAILF